VKTLARSWVSASALCCLAAACEQRAPAPSYLSGYNHTYDHSSFDIGNMVSEIDEDGMHKIVGSVGTFATEVISKAAVATPNVPFPNSSTGVYPGDADAQNAAVRSYFVSAGLPEDQIASMSADATGVVHGQDTVAGWYSLLHRGYDGVLIDDSIATAAFDASRRSASEQVYWPEISSEVLAQVRAFQEMLADPVQKAAYIQKLPASGRDANLVIHHTSWFWQGPFQAQACCRGAIPGNLCFDITGHPVQLPDEVAMTQ
jgi:hypothetical protein